MVKFNESNGILSIGIGNSGNMTKFGANVNLKGFYNELHDLLVDDGYKDMLGTSDDQKKGKFIGNWKKEGELVDGANNNRTGDMFEKKFILIENQAASDLEINWKAFKKAPYSKFGWFEFELNFVNRFLQDKEILDGNNKKTLQSGTWEIKITSMYKNNVINEYLGKIPFVKNSEFLKDLYINHIYAKTLENDVQICNIKLYPKINKLIFKHFGL